MDSWIVALHLRNDISAQCSHGPGFAASDFTITRVPSVMTTCSTAAPKASKKKAQDRWMFAEILAQLTFHWGLNSYLFFGPQQHISRITA
jgi:hypothetical protein